MNPRRPSFKWAKDIPVNVDLIETKHRYYLDDRDIVFGVFPFGTIVVPPDQAATQTAVNAALKTLRSRSPDFRVKAMDDGNYMVYFNGPAAGFVAREELVANRTLITERLSEALLPSEHLAQLGKSEPDDVLIGLLARSRLFLDLDAEAPARIIASPRAAR